MYIYKVLIFNLIFTTIMHQKLKGGGKLRAAVEGLRNKNEVFFKESKNLLSILCKLELCQLIC